jgi:hypothetical protein
MTSCAISLGSSLILSFHKILATLVLYSQLIHNKKIHISWFLYSFQYLVPFIILAVTVTEHKLWNSSSSNFLLLFRRSLSLSILMYLFIYKNKKLITDVSILAITQRISFQSEVFLTQLPRNQIAHLLRGKNVRWAPPSFLHTQNSLIPLKCFDRMYSVINIFLLSHWVARNCVSIHTCVLPWVPLALSCFLYIPQCIVICPRTFSNHVSSQWQ